MVSSILLYMIDDEFERGIPGMLAISCYPWKEKLTQVALRFLSSRHNTDDLETLAY